MLSFRVLVSPYHLVSFVSLALIVLILSCEHRPRTNSQRQRRESAEMVAATSAATVVASDCRPQIEI